MVTSADLTKVDFTTSQTGWAVGASGTIIASTDGGATWKTQTSGVSTPLWDLSVVNANKVWVAGGDDVGGTGLVLRTDSGGE